VDVRNPDWSVFIPLTALFVRHRIVIVETIMMMMMIIIIIIIFIFIIGISFMQGIYTYIPETNHVSREHRVEAVLVLLYMVLISLVPCVDSIVSLC